MLELAVSPIYVAIISIWMAVLSTLAGAKRGATGIPLGDGGRSDLALAVRRFGNLSEYAAILLILLVLMEVKGVEDQWLHLYGSTLVALRILHPFVLFDDMGVPFWRKAGRFVSAGGTALLLLSGSGVISLL